MVHRDMQPYKQNNRQIGRWMDRQTEIVRNRQRQNRARGRGREEGGGREQWILEAGKQPYRTTDR